MILGEGGGTKGGYKPPKKVLGKMPSSLPRKQLLGPEGKEESKPKAAPETSGAGDWLMQKLFNTLLHSATKEKRFSESDYVKTEALAVPMPKARAGSQTLQEMAWDRMPKQRLSQEEFNKLSKKQQQALRDEGQKKYADILKRLTST